MKVIVELPYYSVAVGGITESIKLASHLNAEVRFQRASSEHPKIAQKWSIGLPDFTFPASDVVITYSDNPYIDRLVALPQVKKVLIYMLSFGMAIDRERKNVHTQGVTVMCSTKKIEKAIQAEGVDVHRVGFALDMSTFENYHTKRENYLAIYYSPMQSKRYDLAVKVADYLYKEGLIQGVLGFGAWDGWAKQPKPEALLHQYHNIGKKDVAYLFNSCKCFLMPSTSEGLNLTPIEATLCGCPSVLCDGAIDEIFFDELNCKIAEKLNEAQMIEKVVSIFPYFEEYSKGYEKKMREVVAEFTWDKVINNITQLL